MRPGLGSNGCSPPKPLAPKWAVPIPIQPLPSRAPKSHNHCAEELVDPDFTLSGQLPMLERMKNRRADPDLLPQLAQQALLIGFPSLDMAPDHVPHPGQVSFPGLRRPSR